MPGPCAGHRHQARDPGWHGAETGWNSTESGWLAAWPQAGGFDPAQRVPPARIRDPAAVRRLPGTGGRCSGPGPARRGPALPAARQGFRGARSWHRRIAAGRRGEGRPSFGV